MNQIVHGNNELTMFSIDGERKYMTPREGNSFLREAGTMDKKTRVFCRLLHFTGCRISEALELTTVRLIPDCGGVVLRTLKRRQLSFRVVPVPASLMAELVDLASGSSPSPTDRIWNWSRQTAWRRVKKVIAAAGIEGPQAMPKGLRHQFGVGTMQTSVPLPVTQSLLGHASPNTTVIYQHVTGDDVRGLLFKWWRLYGEK